MKNDTSQAESDDGDQKKKKKKKAMKQVQQKNLQTINTGEDVEKREPCCTIDGNVN